MTTQPKYYLEIDVYGAECDDFEPQWAGYETIVTEGDNLDELLGNATVSAVDQDGGELSCDIPADKSWMQNLIAKKFYEKFSKGPTP